MNMTSYLGALSGAIAELHDAALEEQMRAAAAVLGGASHVWCTGVGKSARAASLLAEDSVDLDAAGELHPRRRSPARRHGAHQRSSLPRALLGRRADARAGARQSRGPRRGAHPRHRVAHAGDRGRSADPPSPIGAGGGELSAARCHAGAGRPRAAPGAVGGGAGADRADEHGLGASGVTIRHLPNAITFARLVGCILFAWLFSHAAYGAALALYVVLELLDQADGKLAKALHLETTTGKFFDPFVDSLTHLTAFAGLLSIGRVPLWALLVFVFREFGLLFLRLLASLQGTQLGGHWPGKTKALVHAVVVILALGVVSGRLTSPLWPLPVWIDLAAAASVLSGVYYAARYRGVIVRAFSEPS